MEIICKHYLYSKCGSPRTIIPHDGLAVNFKPKTPDGALICSFCTGFFSERVTVAAVSELFSHSMQTSPPGGTVS